MEDRITEQDSALRRPATDVGARHPDGHQPRGRPCARSRAADHPRHGATRRTHRRAHAAEAGCFTSAPGRAAVWGHRRFGAAPPTYGVPFDRVIGLIAGGDGALRRAVEHCRGRHRRSVARHGALPPHSRRCADRHRGIGNDALVIGGLRAARRHGLLTGSITCNPASPVAAEAEYALEAVVGPGVRDRIDAHEGRNGPEIDAQHVIYGGNDPAGTRRRQPHGQHAADQRQSSWPAERGWSPRRRGLTKPRPANCCCAGVR